MKQTKEDNHFYTIRHDLKINVSLRNKIVVCPNYTNFFNPFADIEDKKVFLEFIKKHDVILIDKYKMNLEDSTYEYLLSPLDKEIREEIKKIRKVDYQNLCKKVDETRIVNYYNNLFKKILSFENMNTLKDTKYYNYYIGLKRDYENRFGIMRIDYLREKFRKLLKKFDSHS